MTYAGDQLSGKQTFALWLVWFLNFLIVFGAVAALVRCAT